MADEIKITAKLSIENGEYSDDVSLAQQTFDQAAQGGVAGVQEIGFAAHEAIEMGDVATAGWAWFKNLDIEFIQK